MRDGEKSTQKTVFIEVMSSTGPFILTDTQRGPCVQTGGFLKEKSKICLDHSYIEYFRLQSFSARDFFPNTCLHLSAHADTNCSFIFIDFKF